jgi:hypothetical protein
LQSAVGHASGLRLVAGCTLGSAYRITVRHVLSWAK